MLFLFGRSNKVTMFLIRAQCSVVPSPQTNILIIFQSSSKSSIGLNNSTLPPPQGVYTQILILYNFCVLNIYPKSSSCCCLGSISLFWYLLSRVAWCMAGYNQAVIASCKRLYLELRIFNIDLELLRSGVNLYNYQ